jgi:hypothetical protein
MTAPASDRTERAFPTVRLGPGQSLLLEVDTCDVVPALQSGEAPALRMKGRRLDEHGIPGDRCQVFLDIAMVEAVLKRRGLLRTEIPELPRGEPSRNVALTRRRLEITRRVVLGRGQITSWDIRPVSAIAPDQQLEEKEMVDDMRWALEEARELVVHERTQADGFAVGFADVNAIAERLFIERRRSRQGRT